MFYGQKNYNEIIGVNGIYRIAQTGCFLVSFCNMLKDEFGIDINPLDLNARFRDGGFYVDAPPKDNVLDDLGFGSISQVFPEVVVSGHGAGAPPSSNALVRFHYQSITKPYLPNGEPNMIDHFCWVYSAEDHTIIDSWDGQIKSWDVYGGPVEWATYDRHQAVQINPVHPIELPNYTDITVQPGWGIMAVLLAAGYTEDQAKNEKEWLRVANLNGSDQLLKLQPGQVVKVYHEALPPEPAVQPEVAPVPESPAPVSPEPPVEDTRVTEPTAETAPADWRQTFDSSFAGRYICVRETPVINLANPEDPSFTIIEGKPASVSGMVTKDGVKYLRASKYTTDEKYYVFKAEDMSHQEIEPVPADDSDIDAIANDPSFINELKHIEQHLGGRQHLLILVASVINFLRRIHLLKK